MLPPDDEDDRAARVMLTLASSSILDDPRADHFRARVESALFGTEEPPPLRVGRYRLLESIGHGAMGEVVAAFDDVLERSVAIKLVHRTLVRSSIATVRLLQEAKALARLDHPGVVGVYEAGMTDGRAWIAMERVVGHDLRTWSKLQPRSCPEILRVLVEAGRGLQAAHEIGLVHRDFKPDNVLVDDRGRPRVADFGLVRVFADAGAESEPGRSAPDRLTDSGAQHQPPLTRTGALLGTPAYMAPEQLDGAPADTRSDQFAFCVTAWEALFGGRPFVGSSPSDLRQAIAAGRVQPPRSRRVPRAVVRALLRGLHVDPARRHPDLAALLDVLSRPRPTRRMVGVAVASVAVVATFVWALSDRRPCDDAVVRDLWSPRRGEAMRAAFESSGLPYARPAADRAVARLDRWAAEWSAAFESSCRADGSSASSKLERVCLEHGRLAFEALVDSLSTADPLAIEHATDAVDRLPPASACLDGDPPAGHVDPPTDCARAAAVADALASTGRSASALGLATIVAAEAEARDDHDARILALRAAGRCRLDLGHTEAGLSDLLAAADLATALARDETAAAIWTELSSVAATEVRDAGRAAEWLARAEAWTARTGSDPRAGRLSLARAQVLALADPRAAHRALDDLLVVLAEAGPDAVALRLDVLQARASAAFELGRFAEAAVDYRALMLASGERYGEDHPRTVACAYNLGIALDRAGSPDAIEHYGRALDSWVRLYPTGNPDVARVHVALANAELARGSIAAARRHATSALDVLQRLQEPDVPVLAEAWIALGSVQHAAGEYREAAGAHARAQSIYEDTLGTTHAFTAIARSNRAEALVHLGEADEAARELERAAAELRDALGPDHPYLAYPEKGLGIVALGAARLEDAQSHLRRARELAGDHDPVERVEIEYALARVVALAGAPAAEALAEIRERATRLGPSALRRVEAIDRIVENRPANP